jgi:hypothetical protein
MCLFVSIEQPETLGIRPDKLKRVKRKMIGFAVSRFRNTSISAVSASVQWPPSENSRTTNQTYNLLTISEDFYPQLSKAMIPLKLLFSI